jgi:hypothetical protein
MQQTVIDVLIHVLGPDLSAERVDDLTFDEVAERADLELVLRPAV